MTRVKQFILQRKELLLLASMLELLHFSIWLDFGSPLSRSLMLTHLGLFLIWQPVWRGDAKLAWYNGLIFIILTLVFVTWMNLWLLSAWLLLLCGVCGGRVVINRQQRITYMLAMLFLVSELLIACTAMLFDIEIHGGVSGLFSMLLPILPLIMIFLPYGSDEKEFVSVDIIHASATMLLISLLVAGSLLNMYRSDVDYITAMVQTLIAIGLLLLLISWLLSTRIGISDFSQLWMRSVLNIGTPFEQWLMAIDSHFERESTPEEFLEAAAWELVSLPWINGVRWKTATSEGEYGDISKLSTEIVSDQISITLYGHRISGALYLHCKLLVQIINNFYVAKIRERTQTQQAHIQAIHETGARITHDIKNLLQSLQAITSIIQSDDDQTHLSQQLLRKQLPNLTQRLQLALDKLQTPHASEQEAVYLKDWWDELRKRLSLTNVRFHSDISGDPVIPADLFDSTMDNLMDNLREKIHNEPDITIAISIEGMENHVRLMICDTGSMIPAERARRLFNEPMESDSGLGIGLYQAARQAEASGYRLRICDNRDGKVCFELTNAESD